jgi:hypothetical protein
MNCCKCDQPGTVRSPGGSWYCEEHSHCGRCGCSVKRFVPYIISGTITVNVYVCSCVIQGDIDAHNEGLMLKSRRQGIA